MFDFTTKGWNRTAKLICAFSVIAMLAGAALAIHRISYLNEAIVAKATITKVAENKTEDGKLQYSTVYVFSDQRGKEVKVVSTKSARPPVVKVGDQIELLYLASNPKDVLQNHFFTKWGLSVITGGIGFIYFLVFALIAHLTDKRLLRQESPSAPVAV